MPTSPTRWTIVLSSLLLNALPAFGQVALTDNGPSVTLANGIITATIQKNNGQITSMTLGDLETVKGNVYYSMDGGSTYQTPGPCAYSITSQTFDFVDLSFFQTYGNQAHAFDIDIHYVLRAGDSGVYSYAILSHPPSYPATSVGEWRTVWKHRTMGPTSHLRRSTLTTRGTASDPRSTTFNRRPLPRLLKSSP